MGLSDSAKSKSDGYKVQISNGAGIDIVADMPEQFTLAVSNNFEGRDGAISPGDVVANSVGSIPFIQQVAPALADAGALIGRTADVAFGGAAQSQVLGYAVWKGTSPIEFSLQLIFDAETNTRADVHEKLVMLTWLSLPENHAGGILSPPTPSYTGFSAGGWLGTSTPISVRIGRQYYFDSVAILSAAPATETRLNNDLPIAGAIDLQIRTIVAYGKGDWLKAASMRGSGAGQSGSIAGIKGLFGG